MDYELDKKIRKQKIESLKQELDDLIKEDTRKDNEERQRKWDEEREAHESASIYPVVALEWIESEAGWGQRPDGYSIHLTEDDCTIYLKEYWDSMPKGSAPPEYSRESGKPYAALVTEEVWNELKNATMKHCFGIRIWEHQKHKHPVTISAKMVSRANQLRELGKRSK